MSLALAFFVCFQAFAQTTTPSSADKDRLAELAGLISQSRSQPIDDVGTLALEALELLKRHPDTETEIGVRLGLSWALAKQGDAKEAENHARIARTLALDAEFDQELGEAEYYLGVTLFYQARLEEALEAGGKAREIQEGNGDLSALATTLTLLGAVHRSAGFYDLALESHLKALEVATALNDSRAMARSCLPAHRPVTRATRTHPPSRWASSACADWHRAWRANWRLSRWSAPTFQPRLPRPTQARKAAMR